MFRFVTREIEGHRPRPAPAGIDLRLLRETDVLALCADPELDLRCASVKAAYGRGDLCVAAFEGSAVAGYCWLGFAPLPHLDGVWVSFDRRVVWTYKSLVRPSHRGQGVAAALYAFGDTVCLDRGRTQSVICTETHNRASIRAGLRAGYAPAGYGAYRVRGKRLMPWCSPRAKALGVGFFLPG